MNYLKLFFDKKVALSNFELTIFKLAIMLLGMVFGSFFADCLRPFLIPMLIVGLLAACWITGKWWKAMIEDSF